MNEKRMLFVTCTRRQLNTIVEEWTDWFDAYGGAKIALYGVTELEKVGFILLQWSQPIPESFIQRLRTDDDIIDYVPYDAALQNEPVLA